MGEALWDVLPEGKKIGGAPANFAYHAAQYGLDTLAISALGNDALGDEIAQKFADKKLNVLMPRVPFTTGTVQVSLDAQGVPTYDIKEGELLLDSFKRCDILKINDEELVTIGRLFGYPGLDMTNKCWLILGKYNLDALVLTCGVNGSYVFTPGAMSFLETPKVEVADTVGAGDSFTGSFCAAYLSGIPVSEAHRLAVETSAFVCTQNGAMPTLPKNFIDRIK